MFKALDKDGSKRIGFDEYLKVARHEPAASPGDAHPAAARRPPDFAAGAFLDFRSRLFLLFRSVPRPPLTHAPLVPGVLQVRIARGDQGAHAVGVPAQGGGLWSSSAS